MADRYAARQAIDDLTPGECVADEAEPALRMEPAAVIADDAGGLLAAVLERMQAERRDCRSVRMAVDAEHAAFLAKPVAVEVQIEIQMLGMPIVAAAVPKYPIARAVAVGAA